MSDRFNLESKAFSSLGALMQQAAECRSLFEAARLPLPEPLRRMLGDQSPEPSAPVAKMTLLPPEHPPRPAHWESSWIWLAVSSLTATSLVCGLLREAKAPLSPKEILAKCEEMGIDAVKGSIANIGTRLSAGASPKISRGNGAWALVDPSRAPVLHAGHAWGPPEIFDKQELAAHRRDGVIHLLKASDDGYQIVQITKILRQCDWVHAPVTKDLIKVDLQMLQADGKAKRVGNSGKWRATHKD